MGALCLNPRAAHLLLRDVITPHMGSYTTNTATGQIYKFTRVKCVRDIIIALIIAIKITFLFMDMGGTKYSPLKISFLFMDMGGTKYSFD